MKIRVPEIDYGYDLMCGVMIVVVYGGSLVVSFFAALAVLRLMGVI